jgi:peptide/nickel transport system permease protein
MTTESTQLAAEGLISNDQRISPFKSVMLLLWANPSARLGGFLVVIMVSLSIGVLIFDSGYDARRDRDLRARYAPPDCIIGWLGGDQEEFTCEHPFGADKNGRDIMRRVGHGLSVSLSVGVFVVVLSSTVGSAIGLTAGFLGGWVDSVIMRLMDVMLAFPALLLAIALVSVFGASLQNGMLAISITQIPRFARLARSTAIAVRNTEYVLAARALGASNTRMLIYYVLPNSLAPLIVQSTLLLGTAVIETAALGFLGLGQQPPFPELGKMLADSQQALASGKWWVMVFPGIAIVLIVLGFNLLGDGLRDALDPRLRGTD